MFKSLFQITSLLHITASLENTPNMLSWFSLHVWRHLQAQRQTQQDKRLCLRLLSVRDPHPPTPHTPPFPPQPPIYLGGCYREGRWLITINRTERESEQGGRAHQLTGPRRPKLRKWKPVARREEKQLYGNTKLIPPSDLILHAPPRPLLPALGTEPSICWLGTDGQWAPPSLQLDTGYADTVRPGMTESHLVPSNLWESGAERAKARAVS